MENCRKKCVLFDKIIKQTRNRRRSKIYRKVSKQNEFQTNWKELLSFNINSYMTNLKTYSYFHRISKKILKKQNDIVHYKIQQKLSNKKFEETFLNNLKKN